jgi:thioredoxin reductase (NADPH)
MNSIVIDSLEYAGGQCATLYPQKPIYDIPAFTKILAKDLIGNLQDQAAQFKPTYLLGNRVEQLRKTNEGEWELITNKNNKILTKSIIIAGGCGSFGPNRPPLANIEEYEDKSVFYFIDEIEKYRNKIVLIAGGGDSALDWAIILSDIAKKVYLVHRRDKFRAFEASVNKLHELAALGKVELVTPYQLDSVAGSNGMIQAITVADFDGKKKEIAADYLLPFFGVKMDLGPIATWGLNLDKNHIKVEASTMETNTASIFAAGDIASYHGKLKLILTGFAESALAVHSAYKYAFPNKALHFEYSTNKTMPGQ